MERQLDSQMTNDTTSQGFPVWIVIVALLPYLELAIIFALYPGVPGIIFHHPILRIILVISAVWELGGVYLLARRARTWVWRTVVIFLFVLPICTILALSSLLLTMWGPVGPIMDPS